MHLPERAGARRPSNRPSLDIASLYAETSWGLQPSFCQSLLGRFLSNLRALFWCQGGMGQFLYSVLTAERDRRRISGIDRTRLLSRYTIYGRLRQLVGVTGMFKVLVCH